MKTVVTYFGTVDKKEIKKLKQYFSPLTKTLILEKYIIGKKDDTIEIKTRGDAPHIVTEDQLNLWAATLEECLKEQQRG